VLQKILTFFKSTSKILLALSVPGEPLFLQFLKIFQGHNSPGDSARELFKPYTDSASLELLIKIIFFSFWV